MVNRVVIVGRIGKAPESRATQTGKEVASFSVAVKKFGKDAESDWFSVQCWDKTASYVMQYLGKGRLVAIDGRLSSRKYTAKDGTEREVVEIVADSVQSLDRPKDDAPSAAPARSGFDPTEFDPFAGE